MIVLAKPFNKCPGKNAYNTRLYNAIIDKGVVVVEWTKTQMLFGKYDVLHLHWPENILNRNSALISFILLFFLMTALLWTKARNKIIVWTAHNLKSHNKRHPILEKYFWKMFFKFIDGIICLNPFYLPSLKEKTTKITYIPLGNYKDVYPNISSYSESREKIGYSPDCKILLILGRLERYKGILEFIQNFNKLRSNNIYLVIRGKTNDKEYWDHLKKAASLNSRISIKNEFIEDYDLQFYINAADIVVCPTNSVWNSSSALLGLSFNKPVLSRKNPVFDYLEKQVFKDWVFSYHDKMFSDSLIKLILDKVDGLKNKIVPFDGWEWETIADKHIEFYKSQYNNNLQYN